MKTQVSFKVLPGPSPRLQITTAAFNRTLRFDDQASFETACKWRNELARQIFQRLEEDGGYPEEVGAQMLSSLHWNHGLPELEAAGQPVRFLLNRETCTLLPELVPTVGKDGTVRWLDQLAPVARTLEHYGPGFPPAPRRPRLALAIVYQDLDAIHELVEGADGLRRSLEASGLEVNCFSGAGIAPGGGRGYAVLGKIFREHRGVLFLGQALHDAVARARGWRLTADGSEAILKSDLQDFFCLPATLDAAPAPPPSVPRMPMAEVVFANCCSSARFDPHEAAADPYPFPHLFLLAGARFYIGTATDVFLDPPRTRRLLESFFSAWARLPAEVVTHLHRAKRACGFPLVTGLYQIYTTGLEPDPEPEPSPGAPSPPSGPPRPEPMGAAVSALVPGDRLREGANDFVLGPELARDLYARLFHATRGDAAFLVQLLADPWQGVPDLPLQITEAIRRLRSAGLGEGHLIPHRLAEVQLVREGCALCSLHALVFDRPAGEPASAWSPAMPGVPAGNRARFEAILDIGVEIAGSLAELHACGFAHGNLSAGCVLGLGSGPHPTRRWLLKDSWLYSARLGRATATGYAAPEEATRGEATAKSDSWALGFILYEIAAGQPPFDESHPPELGLTQDLRSVLGPDVATVPEALERVIRECLVPAAELRPTATEVAGRLRLARQLGGGYLGDFAQAVNQSVQAGHRHFFVAVDDFDELTESLGSLTGHPQPFLAQGGGLVRYRLYSIEHGRGLWCCQTGELVKPWCSSEALHRLRLEAYGRPGYPTPPPPDALETAAVNGRFLLLAAQSLPRPENTVPLVLLRGCEWWNTGLDTHRIIRQFQTRPLATPSSCRQFDLTRPAGPVLILADDFLRLDADLARSFVTMRFPPPSPSALFERILRFAREEPPSDSPLEVPMAIQLASRFVDSSWREVKSALRSCALRHGVLDERALLIRDETREQAFRRIPGLQYLPCGSLGDPSHFAFPSGLNAAVDTWCAAIGSPDPARAGIVPRRLLAHGPAGCGKSTIARVLAARLGRPLVRIEPGQCYGRLLGESESRIREALSLLDNLDTAVVLLDDVDQTLAQAGDRSASQDADGVIALRLSGILTEWLDRLPAGLFAVLTARQPEALSAGWLRRMEWRLGLPEPSSSAGGDATDRIRIFSALFRKHGLVTCAEDQSLMHRLAEGTEPSGTHPRMLSPLAVRAVDPVLSRQTVQLRSGADIEAWVADTLRLNGGGPEVRTPEFWDEALIRSHAGGTN